MKTAVTKTAGMLDRQKIEAILMRRFPGASRDQVAAAANGIMGLDDEWEELAEPDHHRHPEGCPRADCLLARELERGSEVRLFRRRDG